MAFAFEEVLGPALKHAPDGSLLGNGMNPLRYDAVLPTRKEAAENLGRFSQRPRQRRQFRGLPGQKYPVAVIPGGTMVSALPGSAHDGFLFPSSRGRALHVRNVRRVWFTAAAVAAGVPGLTPHERRQPQSALPFGPQSRCSRFSGCSGTVSPASPWMPTRTCLTRISMLWRTRSRAADLRRLGTHCGPTRVSPASCQSLQHSDLRLLLCPRDDSNVRHPL